MSTIHEKQKSLSFIFLVERKVRVTLLALVFGLILAGVVQAQIGSSISADGTAPNDNAMLDVQSPATGAGKGMLIPRITLAQRTTASAVLDGGLLDDSGNLRGGAAHGLIVYQTDGVQGLYFNTSSTALPTWEYYLPCSGGTMSGALNMGAQIVTNVAHIDFNGINVSVGRQAIGTNYGAAVGYQANGSDAGAAVGYQANGSGGGAAVGYQANGSIVGAAVGYVANGTKKGATVGYYANGSDSGVAVGYLAFGQTKGVAMGHSANGTNYGTVVGYQAFGQNQGAALGYSANGSYSGVAVGYVANGAKTNVAIGVRANAQGGTQRIAIGHNVTNTEDNTARIRGNLYLDGASGGVYTNVGGFGSSDWGLKAFTIDHPLDPENKVLRHFCLEGPEVWNVYAGNAQLKNGFAVVELPNYYSAMNLVGSEICSLTPWGRANVWVARGVDSNTFSIAGDTDVKVSWTIKVLRNDPGCLEDLRRRPVEQMKSEMPRQSGSNPD